MIVETRLNLFLMESLMNKEMDEFLRLTFIQMLCDEWSLTIPKLQASKSIKEAYEIYQSQDLRIYNLNRYMELRINNSEDIEDATI